VPLNSPKYICSECRLKIPAEDLESIFVEQLKTALILPKDIDAYFVGASPTLQKKKRCSSRAKGRRTYRLYPDKEISNDAFRRFFRPIEERQHQLEEGIPISKFLVERNSRERIAPMCGADDARSLYSF
jgi:hypothetical protein